MSWNGRGFYFVAHLTFDVFCLFDDFNILKHSPPKNACLWLKPNRNSIAGHVLLEKNLYNCIYVYNAKALPLNVKGKSSTVKSMILLMLSANSSCNLFPSANLSSQGFSRSLPLPITSITLRTDEYKFNILQLCQDLVALHFV